MKNVKNSEYRYNAMIFKLLKRFDNARHNLEKVKLTINIITNMGAKYTLYRFYYELVKRSGLLRRKHPATPTSCFYISLDLWKKTSPAFLIQERELLTIPRVRSSELKNKTNQILEGKICFFSHEWKTLGKEYDWISNLDSGFKYDINRHWSEINDLNPNQGDIKYVWEKSRFTYLLTIIRNDYHNEEDHSDFVFSEIENWITANPVNKGPNWLCSQEISLRIFNWCYALYFYKNSKSLTEQRWQQIQNVIYWSLHHVYQNINFSRITVRNNHAITETLFLTVSELIFPFIPSTSKWANKGRKWLEKEITYQIYEDGTFLQFSLNYHRVVIQLLSFALALTETNNKPLAETIYERSYKSLDFLYQCLQEENGNLPNYGYNDGALFFPLADTDYRDFRPQLNTLHKILTGASIYTDRLFCEESEWVKSTLINKTLKTPLKKKYGTISYPFGGYYLLRENDSFTFIRCGNHKDRPAQADNLHLDVWHKGINILRDSGSYKYNTEQKYLSYFTGTGSHNTVRIAEHSQMLKGSRFIWYFWTQAHYAQWEENDTEYVFNGRISAFKQLNPKITHGRQLIKSKNKNIWIVKDEIANISNVLCYQQWHKPENTTISFEAKLHNGLKPLSIATESYASYYYGIKEKGSGFAFQFSNSIETTIQI